MGERGTPVSRPLPLTGHPYEGPRGRTCSSECTTRATERLLPLQIGPHVAGLSIRLKSSWAISGSSDHSVGTIFPKAFRYEPPKAEYWNRLSNGGGSIPVDTEMGIKCPLVIDVGDHSCVVASDVHVVPRYQWFEPLKGIYHCPHQVDVKGS